VPYLDIFQVTAQRFTKEGVIKTKKFEVNPNRLTKQVIYFTVTAQVVNFVLEVVVPYVKRKATKTVQEVQEEYTSKKGASAHIKDAPEEAAFLDRVRAESELEEYDVTTDYREMVVQFGYLSLFSVVWPLTACSFLVNNWIEARSDAMKIAIGSQRPIPWRADSIGPWLNSLGFLSWLGSLTSAAIVFLFREDPAGPDGSPWDISAWALLLSILFAEHIYLVIQLVVRHAIDRLESPGLQKEKAERFAMRKRLLAETLGEEEAEKAMGPAVTGGAKITREALEEEARQASRKGSRSAEDAFWLRQRGPEETIQVGRGMIKEVSCGHRGNARR
jgi:anoctamin-10